MHDPARPASEFVLPNFIIVGAMKAGTTSLAAHLRAHPEVFVAPHEIHFFTAAEKWQAGPEWYASHFREAQGKKAIGEKSPSYAYRPGLQPPVARRIVELLPEVRIIWCFRNPIDRAYSHYWHFVRKGRERLSFERAFERRRGGGTSPPSDYAAHGQYAENIRTFAEHVGLGRMRFVILEHMRKAPAEVVGGVHRFLDLEPIAPVSGLDRVRNRGWTPRSRLAQRLLRPLEKSEAPAARRLLEWNRREGYPPMTAAVRSRLADYYQPHNEALAELTGLDLTCWHEPARQR